MFNLIADGLQAYNQIGLFIGALICLAIGCFVLGYSLYERAQAFRAMGTIIGVICHDGMFRPVYRYTAPDGQPHMAQSQINSSWARGKETGRVVPLLISARDPGEAREANSYLLDITGIVFSACGIWLGHIALSSYPITLMTWIMALAILVILAERGYRTLRRPQLSFDQWRQQLKARKTTAIDLADVKPIEHILAGPDRRKTQLHKFKTAAPLLVLFAGILVWLGFHQSIKLAHLESTGLRAHGEVVRLQDEDSDGSRLYHAVVRFRTDKNVPIEFKDNVGSNPPSYRRGAKVTVLYLADNPREAMIDRGFFNWAIPALLFLVAAFVLWLLVVMLRGAAPPKTAIPDPTAASP
jgi:Protein of unknown function (DUF3592)